MCIRDRAKLDPAMTKSILALGLPAGFQNAIFAIANLFIQAGVNSFDSLMVKGNSAAANADPLIYDCMAAFLSLIHISNDWHGHSIRRSLPAGTARKVNGNLLHEMCIRDRRYGFIYVNKFDDGTGDLSREKKDSFYWYKKVIASNGENLE